LRIAVRCAGDMETRIAQRPPLSAIPRQATRVFD
jgi:hypothetical protein